MSQQYIPMPRNDVLEVDGGLVDHYLGSAHILADDVRSAIAMNLQRPLYATTLVEKNDGRTYVVVDVYSRNDQARDGRFHTKIHRALSIRLDRKNHRLVIVNKSHAPEEALERSVRFLHSLHKKISAPQSFWETLMP